MNTAPLSLARGRTPNRPGPGPIPDAALSVVELRLARRIHGQRSGDERALGRGPGLELDRIRPYAAGDDIRTIDWNVTARTGETHVREHVPERDVTTWLLLDRSPSMHFGTASRRKADVEEGVARVFGHLATRRHGRLGVIAFGAGADPELVARPGLHARQHLDAHLGRDVPEEGAGRTTMTPALRLASRAARRRGLVVIVSDFRGELDWRSALAEVVHRHTVVAVEIVDPREDRLVDVGELALVDPETGRMIRVDTADRRLRHAFERGAAAERRALASQLRALGVHHIRLSTEGPWLTALIRGLEGRLR